MAVALSAFAVLPRGHGEVLLASARRSVHGGDRADQPGRLGSTVSARRAGHADSVRDARAGRDARTEPTLEPDLSPAANERPGRDRGPDGDPSTGPSCTRPPDATPDPAAPPNPTPKPTPKPTATAAPTAPPTPAPTAEPTPILEPVAFFGCVDAGLTVTCNGAGVDPGHVLVLVVRGRGAREVARSRRTPYDAPGDYPVTLTVSNAFGSDADSMTVNVGG